MVNRYGLIYATTSNGAFSFKNKLGLPWPRHTLDLSVFKALTLGTCVVMGRKTMESLSKPLPGRENYVITRGEPMEGFKKISFDELRKTDLGIVWFIGGTSILDHAMDYFEPKVIVHNEIKTDIDKISSNDLTYFYDPFNGPLSSLRKKYTLNLSEDLVSHIYVDSTKDISNLDQQYLDIMAGLINSEKVTGRNGTVRSAATEDISIVSDESEGFPIIQSKYTWLNGVKSELDFFMKGQTDSTILEKQKNYIWSKNTRREFLDGRGLFSYNEGDMGPMYGFKWRHYGEKYLGSGKEYKGYDQLEFVVNEIINNPGSRRIMMTTYDPTTVSQQVLCECHGIATQFFVRGDVISLKTYQRSADWFLGVPFNISSYALLLRRIVEMVNERSDKKYRAGKSITIFGDAHLYESHLIPAVEAIVYSNFQDYKKVELDSKEILNGYKSRKIKAEMIE